MQDAQDTAGATEVVSAAPTDESQVAVNQMIAELTEKAISLGLNILAALVIIVVGMFIAGWVKRTIRKGLTKTDRIDQTLAGFLSSLVYYIALALVFIMVIGRFGIPTASFAAVLGAAGLAIGLALQGTLGNVASGVMILMFRPFRIGDFVTTGDEMGTVKDINLFTTEITTLDNKNVMIPNGMVWQSPITNFSANDTRRIEAIFGIAYDADINKAMDVIRSVIEADERFHTEPEPAMGVASLGDWSVNITVRVWVARTDFLVMGWELNQKVKEAFDREGVGIPFPTAIEYQARFKPRAAALPPETAPESPIDPAD
ncbi:mechanosensitive ion channel family protein [Aquisalinus luteolus]|uniref:Small-conductance mechanosensitive channel n=2 Tax=Aquisalinus luteolus TaxID=1566827 RepID=A0A8J3EV92_9PROT|nr:mechanosensitive ion channel domain-containing protein [Aquisalinus luteolus]GGH99762.1 mechanosensitive ion channel protein MscS [Aquisalinus luteolus]